MKSIKVGLTYNKFICDFNESLKSMLAFRYDDTFVNKKNGQNCKVQNKIKSTVAVCK